MSTEKETSSDHIEVLFKVHYRELCLFGFRFIDDMDAVEDVVQNVFLHFIDQNLQLDNIDNPRAYFYTAVRNACLKYVKQKQKRMVLESLPYNSNVVNESVESAIIEMERTLQIYQAIDALPKQCKNIFIRCQIDRLKYHEVAEELEISINTVKTQMKKAFRLLRHALKEVYSYSIALIPSLIFPDF